MRFPPCDFHFDIFFTRHSIVSSHLVHRLPLLIQLAFALVSATVGRYFSECIQPLVIYQLFIQSRCVRLSPICLTGIPKSILPLSSIFVASALLRCDVIRCRLLSIELSSVQFCCIPFLPVLPVCDVAIGCFHFVSPVRLICYIYYTHYFKLYIKIGLENRKLL